MAVEPSESLQYVTTVPQGGTGASPWAMESSDGRPLLYISDAGMTPNPSPSRPSVLRSELRLLVTDEKYASRETASYFFDKALLNCLRAGDVFHMAQTGSRGFGASAIRQGKLIFAVGEVSILPLGSGFTARIPMDLLEKATRVFRGRDSKFDFPEFPMEFRIGNISRIIYRGHVEMAGYHVRVEDCFQPVDGAHPECVAISLDEACDWVAASATAQLLNSSKKVFGKIVEVHCDG